jgi:phosphoglycerate kinase
MTASMEYDFFTLSDFPIDGKTVVCRIDVNSPIDPESGIFLDDTRPRLHVETLKALANSKVVLLAHQSRPGKGDYTPLEVHAGVLSGLLKRRVTYIDDLLGSRAKKAVKELGEGEIVLLENVRFYAEEVTMKDCTAEKQAKTHLVKGLANLADFFVNDAFAAAHRSQPSLTGFTWVLPAAAGKLMEKEIKGLSKAVFGDQRPKIAILGGAKADDTLKVMDNLLGNNLVDEVLTTGAVANLFLVAAKKSIGKPSLDFLQKEIPAYIECVGRAASLMSKYGSRIKMPVDVAANMDGQRKNVKVGEFPPQGPIYDVGIDTIVEYANIIKNAGTVIVNGPAGVFELEEFAMGTEEIFAAVADSPAYTVMGGGHTAAAVQNMGLAPRIGHVSSGGGACLAFLSGKPMPVIEALVENKKRYKDKM